MMNDVKSMLADNASLTEEYLVGLFDEKRLAGDTRLAESAKYSVLGGGKRIRATLVLEFCRMFGGSVDAALPFAASIELIHAFSLVHDDMPCMDDDDMRRGKPSCHKVYGEAGALLCGDELFAMAFETMAENQSVPDITIRRVVREFAYLSGAYGMMGGQYYDLCEIPQSYEELVRLHKMKTGALICASCLVGYYSACTDVDNDIVAAISTYAYNIGLAFQITDDILDVIADEAALGKPIGSDGKNGKITSLSFFTIDEARAEAKKLTDDAIAAIADFDKDRRMTDLAVYLLSRAF